MASPNAFLSAALLAASAATATAAVSGRVISDGTPVGGATVSAYAVEAPEARAERLAAGQERRALVSVKASADGTFRLDLAEPLVAIGVRADGFAPAFATALQGEATVVPLTPASLRRGVVTALGRPVAAATLAWLADADDPQSAEAIVRTGADGSYEVPDPDRWATHLAVFHPDFALLVAMPSPKWAATHALAAGTKVEGQVTDGPSGHGVAGATIWLDGWPRARSGAGGTFTVPHAAADWSRIAARTATMAGKGKKGTGRIVIAVQPARRLSGVVRDEATRQPLAGAAIRLLEGDHRGPAGAAVTDARGHYSISGLPPGRYWPYATRPGYAPGGPGQESLDVRQVAAATHDFDLVPLRRASGRVLDEQGRPVEGAIVTLGFEGMGLFYGDILAMIDEDAAPAGVHHSAADGSFTLVLPGFVDEASQSANLQASLMALKAGYAAGLGKLPPAGAPGPAVIVLRKGVVLRGRVAGPDGAPVADAPIAVAEVGPLFTIQSMADGSAEVPAWTRSDAEGRFAVHVNAVRHQLWLRKPGFAPKVVDVAEPGASPELAVVLEPGAAIRGRVVRADGRGVGNATLTLQDSSTPPASAATAVSEADGSFALVDVAAGAYDLQVAHDSGIQATRPVRAPAADVRIELPPTATVRGRVLDAASRAPVPQFSVVFARESPQPGDDDFSGSRTEEVVAADGAFVVEDLPVGVFTLAVQAEGYRTRSTENVVVSTEAGAPDIEIALEPGVSVRGRVTSDGAPLEEAQVSAGAAGGRAEESASTDENGDYEVKGLAPGEVVVHVSKDGYRSVRRTVDVQRGARLDVSLSRGLSIGGIVVVDDAGVPQARVSAHSGTLDADSQSALTDAEGRFTLHGLSPGRYTVAAYATGKGRAEIKDVDVAAAGPLRLVIDRANRAVLTGKVIGAGEGRDGRPPMVMVSVDDQEGNSANAIADGAGSFRIEDAPAGRVAVSAEAMSSSGTRTTGSRELTLAAGSETSTVLEFKDDLVITGTVTRMGAQVGNVSVSFLSGGATATTTTDRAGHYEIGVAGGTYDVSLSGENISFQTTYEAAASGVFDIDVTVGGVRGRTLDAATQAPVADASVSLWLLGKGENVPASTLTTTAQGSFDAPSLREGRYRLVTSKKGYGQEVREVEVTRGSTAEVVFELQPAGGVTVTVADARDGRPLAAIVVVRDADRRIVANRHAGADADGAVTIPLSDGAYLLSTSASGYGTATLPIASPARGLRVGLTPGGTLVIESSQPLPGRIRLMQPDGEEYVRCWCNGIAEIKLEGRRTTVENVAAGPYTMELVDAPGRTFSQAIVIQEGQTTTVAID